MASRVSAVSLVVMLVAAAAVTLPASQAAVTCTQVYQFLIPCLSYLQSGNAAAPPARQCCGGISSLMASLKTSLDRRTTCGCLKTAASGVSGINLNLAGSLPKKCGVSVPYKISPSTDCNKLN